MEKMHDSYFSQSHKSLWKPGPTDVFHKIENLQFNELNSSWIQQVVNLIKLFFFFFINDSKIIQSNV